MDSDYQESTSGTGRLLVLFFGAVILAAVAFALGYKLGKPDAPPPQADVAPAHAPLPGATKPAPGVDAPALTASTASDAMAEPASEDAGVPLAAAKETAKPPVESKPARAATEFAAGKGIMVQVAAVTKQEDADMLAAALRKKQYPVFVVPSTPADKLVRVQVGPFAQLKDAEAMKAKLASDGYNAIVKK